VKRTLQLSGYRVELDLAPQLLGVALPPEFGFGRESETESPLTATLTRKEGFVSASMLAQKAKLFDDGLVAAVELAAQAGDGEFPGKAALLRNIIRLLLARQPSPSRPLVILLGAARPRRSRSRSPASNGVGGDRDD
jgi:hypothetical protein